MQHSATSLYLPVAIVDALRQRAKAADRSTSKEATRLLRQALAAEDREGESRGAARGTPTPQGGHPKTGWQKTGERTASDHGHTFRGGCMGGN
jgi:plasmid stability protein